MFTTANLPSSQVTTRVAKEAQLMHMNQFRLTQPITGLTHITMLSERGTCLLLVFEIPQAIRPYREAIIRGGTHF